MIGPRSTLFCLLSLGDCVVGCFRLDWSLEEKERKKKQPCVIFFYFFPLFFSHASALSEMNCGGAVRLRDLAKHGGSQGAVQHLSSHFLFSFLLFFVRLLLSWLVFLASSLSPQLAHFSLDSLARVTSHKLIQKR